MALHKRRKVDIVSVLLMCMLVLSCAAAPKQAEEEEKTDIIEATLEAGRTREEVLPQPPAPVSPDFVPVREGSSPLSTKTVSIAARHTPLRDVLYTISETASLNLVLERGVDPDLPITITFKDVLIEDALNIIFDSVNYFYSIKDNILIVKAMGTKIFELGQPSVTQEYKVNVGGDILSGISSNSDDTTSTLSGDVSLSSISDSTSFKFWDAIDNSLNSILQSEGSGGNSKQKESFVINRLSGTVMVTASKNNLQKVDDFLTSLKKVLNRQVLVEARIVEVQLSEGLKYGIDWTAVGEWLGAGATTSTLGTDLFTSVISSGEPFFQFSITENDNLTLVLKALEEQGDVRTLSNPRVNILNGQTAMLSVGRNTTFISRVESTTTGDVSSTTTFTVDTSSILSGIMFGLVPYINSNQEVTLTITPIITNLINLESKIIGSGSGSVELSLPTVDLREMSTTVKVLNGQLIIIGGLIDRKESLNEDKIPILGDIPFLGQLFKSVDKSYENKELVIMLIPRVEI
jgi:MSHA type pilus biogenesis protein MshL